MTQITNDILHVEAKTVPLGADVWANDGTGWHGLRGARKAPNHSSRTAIRKP